MAETEAEEILNNRRERRRLPVIGLWLTGAFLVGVIVYITVQEQIADCPAVVRHLPPLTPLLQCSISLPDVLS